MLASIQSVGVCNSGVSVRRAVADGRGVGARVAVRVGATWAEGDGGAGDARGVGVAWNAGSAEHAAKIKIKLSEP
jgi:hypothetical protein